MSEAAGGASDAAAAEPGTPGGMLRAERERRGYSVQHTAEELHLDVRVIEALEANRFDALGAPVYARGHLRKYAALLGLSPVTVIERYEALAGTPSVPTPIPVAMTAPVVERRRMSKVPLLIVVVIAVLAGLAWLALELLWSRGSDTATTREVPAASVPQPAVSEPVVQLTAPVAQTQTPAQATTVQPPAAQTPTPTSPLPRSAGEGREGAATSAQLRMRLEFSEPSWAEIYDASGRRLMYDMGTPGRGRTVAGVPPLRINLGLVSAVRLHIGDQPIVIPRRAGREDVRFLVEADGSVRPDTSLKTAERPQ